jgi:hypothetical protein
MEIRVFRRRSFEVQAVQVTVENFNEAARWAGSYAQQDWAMHDGRPFFEIRIGGFPNQKAAIFVGDWVTLYNGQFNRSSAKSFDSVFEEIKTDRYKRYEEILKLVQTRDAGVPAGDIAQQILNLT